MKMWFGVALRMVFFAAVLMWPAGSLAWWEAWVVVGLWTGFTVAMTIYLARHDPALLAERMKPLPVQKDQVLWDKVLMSVFTILGIALYVTPGLDVVRFQWSDRFPLWLEITAMAIQLPCFWCFWRVLQENTHLSQVVKIENEREHQVITTGPYAIVRHPHVYRGDRSFFCVTDSAGLESRIDSGIAYHPAADSAHLAGGSHPAS